MLDWFDGRIAAELRLWDAIDQHRLVAVRLLRDPRRPRSARVPWRRGRGYDVDGAHQPLTGRRRRGRARSSSRSREHVDDPRRMRALGFCVSVEHARFMARMFESAGIAAVAVWGDSPTTSASAALTDLAAAASTSCSRSTCSTRASTSRASTRCSAAAPDRQPDAVPPAARTRTAPQPRQDRVHGARLRRASPQGVPLRPALPGAARRQPQGPRASRSSAGFRSCRPAATWSSIAVAKEIVLANIREAVPSRWPAKVEELRQHRAAGRRALTLRGYLEETGLRAG